MKKKKLMELIALGLVLAYFAGALIIFTATSSIFGAKFNQQSERIRLYNPMNSYVYHEMDIKEYSERYMYQNSGNYPLFPYAAAIIDKEGNIVARSGSWLKCIDSEGAELFYCWLDPYMTSEIKKTVAESQKEIGYLFSHKFEYNIENGEVVPVKLVLCDYNTENRFAPENLITLTFSDEKAQYSITDNEESGKYTNIYTKFIDTDESSYEHKLYTELYESLESEDVKRTAIRICEEMNFGGGSSSSEFMEWFDYVEIDGETYCIYQHSKRSEFLGTLLSDQFREYLILELLVFIVIGFVIMLAANSIYNKNKILENARIAFTGAAAHELKTPLAVISNQCECILEDIAPEKNKEYVSSIYDEAKRMNRLIVTLLQYNRVSVLDKISKEKADLGSLARAEAEKYSSLFDNRNLNVEIETDNSQINCNTELLSLVIDNFLSNAVKYSPESGTVRITVKKGTLTVFNSGGRVSPADSRHIWDEFYREDKARTSDGSSTGMGLALSRKILELHGCKYGFINVKGGVEFYFSAK